MKARSRLGFLLCFLVLFAQQLRGESSPPLTEPRFDLYQPPAPPTGTLGLPLGTFAVIEGIYHPYGMATTMPGLEIESVNGVKLISPRHIPVDGARLIDGKHYVLHGYEYGSWGGEPMKLPKGEHYGAQVIFCFLTRFALTSVEKIDDITVPGAKSIDPEVPLAVPDFKEKNIKNPVGRLGLQLGTFAIIEVRSPSQLVLMESPFEVISVNGKHLNAPCLISIPGLKELPAGKTLQVHGFEAGEWASQPSLPESEYPRISPIPQKHFQYFPKFNTTSAAAPK